MRQSLPSKFGTNGVLFPVLLGKRIRGRTRDIMVTAPKQVQNSRTHQKQRGL